MISLIFCTKKLPTYSCQHIMKPYKCRYSTSSLPSSVVNGIIPLSLRTLTSGLNNIDSVPDRRSNRHLVLSIEQLISAMYT